MSALMESLSKRAQRGSKPRCHLLTHGTREIVACRLTALADPFATVTPTDHWKPEGFEQIEETELHKAHELLSQPDCETIKRWWFAIYRGGLQTGPSFDVASTCSIAGRRGILLVEAKAHAQELICEEKGKPLRKDPSDGEKKNHSRIAQAIQETSIPLGAQTGMPFSLSRDNRYQMSNRFATACKLTELGYPVVLVYLGFLNACEMTDRGTPFGSHTEWESAVKKHSEPLFPAGVWGQEWKMHGQPFIPLIRSCELSLGENTV